MFLQWLLSAPRCESPFIYLHFQCQTSWLPLGPNTKNYITTNSCTCCLIELCKRFFEIHFKRENAHSQVMRLTLLKYPLVLKENPWRGSGKRTVWGQWAVASSTRSGSIMAYYFTPKQTKNYFQSIYPISFTNSLLPQTMSLLQDQPLACCYSFKAFSQEIFPLLGQPEPIHKWFDASQTCSSSTDYSGYCSDSTHVWMIISLIPLVYGGRGTGKFIYLWEVPNDLTYSHLQTVPSPRFPDLPMTIKFSQWFRLKASMESYSFASQIQRWVCRSTMGRQTMTWRPDLACWLFLYGQRAKNGF